MKLISKELNINNLKNLERGANMMQNIKYFFRGVPDNTKFVQFGLSHLWILIVSTLVSYIIIKHKEENRRLEIFIGIVLIIQQGALYMWYTATNYNVLTQGLPLYHCRIAILFLSIGLLFNKVPLMKLGAYWGLAGAIIALVIPADMDPFMFPHITMVSFFIGHMFLLWGSIYVLYAKKIGITKTDLKRILTFTNTYCVVIYIFNYMAKSNYGFMNSSPIQVGNNLNHFMYGIIVILISNIVINIIYHVLNFTTKEKEELVLVD